MVEECALLTILQSDCIATIMVRSLVADARVNRPFPSSQPTNLRKEKGPQRQTFQLPGHKLRSYYITARIKLAMLHLFYKV